MQDKFDEIIDPEENAAILAEAMGIEIKEEVTILELLSKGPAGNPIRIKVRYLPQSATDSLEYDDGAPMTPPGSKQARKPKFNFKKWSAERIPKLNELALKNIQIKNDALGEKATERGDVLLSKISSGEFFRLEGICFPGASEDAPDSQNQNPVSGRKNFKGLRKDPAPASE